jgi:hypothetical protein
MDTSTKRKGIRACWVSFIKTMISIRARTLIHRIGIIITTIMAGMQPSQAAPSGLEPLRMMLEGTREALTVSLALCLMVTLPEQAVPLRMTITTIRGMVSMGCLDSFTGATISTRARTFIHRVMTTTMAAM